MNEIKVLAHVAREIDRLRKEQSAFLQTGRADDYAAYRFICGTIRGLDQAESIINDLVQHLEKSDD